MSSMWNNRIGISVFGESHGAGIGVVIDNLPSGEHIDMEKIQKFMSRRSAKNDRISTPRKEKDIPEIMSGLYNDVTTGTPLCTIIKNENTQSKDYDNVSRLARPGHADYTGFMRYKGYNDVRGGGHFSGRLTAPLCFAGAVCEQILERRGIFTGGHILSVHGVKDTPFDSVDISEKQLSGIKGKSFPVVNDKAGMLMTEEIDKARKNFDSVGGIIECAGLGVPAGIGSPMFDGLENTISQLVFGIPAVKGIEFGAGFGVCDMFGSENNDEFYVDKDGIVRTYTNNHGGILGGISSGMPIIFKVAFKPTPSISKQQKTIDYASLTDDTIEVKGRHDPCIVPRAVPCVESAVNIALLSHMLENQNF